MWWHHILQRFPDSKVWHCPSELEVLDFFASITASFDEQCWVWFHHLNLGLFVSWDRQFGCEFLYSIWYHSHFDELGCRYFHHCVVLSVRSSQTGFSLSDLVNLTVCLVFWYWYHSHFDEFWAWRRHQGLCGIWRLCCSSGGCEMLIFLLISQPALMSATTLTVVVF